MERATGILFFTLLIVGLALFIYAARKTDPEKRKRWSSWGLTVEAIAFFIFGSLSLLQIHFSARPTLTESISHLVQHHGKYASSDFQLIALNGANVGLHADYSGTRLIENERATVKFIQYNHTLIDLTMLTGPSQGWHLQESDGTVSCWLLFLMGLAGFWGARHEWLRNVNAGTSTSQVDAAVDTSSIINLR
jgi:amino acid transporter